MSTPMNIGTLSPLRNAWQRTWAKRSPREQRLLSLGAWVLALAALWSLALAPALRTWQEAPARQATLDAQSQRMRQLQAQARQLQQPQTLSRTEALQWLEQHLDTLGPNAQISLQADRATLRLQAAPAEAVARWLRQARENAQALPVQANLQQAQAPTALQTPGTRTASPRLPNATTTHSDAHWRGTVVLRLP